jgi:predicted small metal-binding protein
MAKLLNCPDMDIDCDYICAQSEEDLLNRAAQYARLDQSRAEIPSEFQDRARSLMRTIDHC